MISATQLSDPAHATMAGFSGVLDSSGTNQIRNPTPLPSFRWTPSRRKSPLDWLRKGYNGDRCELAEAKSVLTHFHHPSPSDLLIVLNPPPDLVLQSASLLRSSSPPLSCIRSHSRPSLSAILESGLTRRPNKQRIACSRASEACHSHGLHTRRFRYLPLRSHIRNSLPCNLLQCVQ